MLFNSIQYLIFFPLVVILYFLCPRKIKKAFLLGASFFFYSCWNVKYTLLMMLSIVLTYLTGRMVDGTENINRRKFYVFLCFAANLGILFIFKYFNFAVATANRIGTLWGASPINLGIDVLLPVGISFYTFQALGYTIDVYRGDLKAEKNLLHYALFVSFFSQLVAGPIERSTHLLPQLKKDHSFTYENLVLGFIDLIWGFFLKLVIADRVAIFVNEVFPRYGEFSSGSLLLAACFFTVQIYCDFYSYSLIAKGSAKVLGIDLMDNFKEPLFSKSIVEFWRRWHISLSGWFRDYLYIPLGGNRKGNIRHLVNILVVFAVSGLWHGAATTFVLWGMIHGFFNALEAVIKKKRGKRERANILVAAIQHLYTFAVVVFAFVFFRADSTSQGLGLIKNMVTGTWSGGTFLNEIAKSQMGTRGLYAALCGVGLLVIVDAMKYKGVNLREKIANTSWLLRMALFLALLFCTLVFGVYGPGYSESQFIYFQF